MAQSATDAGHWEKKLRQKLVDTGDVDIMVSIGTNFFYTRTLPCSLWFFDRGRPAARKHQTLMLDARGVYRVISRKIRDFSDEQLANLTAIVWLYRGQTERYRGLIGRYLGETDTAVSQLGAALAGLDTPDGVLTQTLDALFAAVPDDAPADAAAAFRATVQERAEALFSFIEARAALLTALSAWHSAQGAQIPTDNGGQVARHDSFQPFVERLAGLRRQINEVHKLTNRAFDTARRDLRATRWDAWDGRAVGEQREALEMACVAARDALTAVTYPFAQVTWMQARFPDGAFADVPGLCTVVRTEEIAEQDYSLTPGRYVGVAPPEPEDEEAVEARLREIHVELASLNEEAMALAQTIAANFGELVG